MSKLRPTLGNARPGSYSPPRDTALLLIHNAVKDGTGLIHGTLHKNGESCAVGRYFDVHDDYALKSDLIDEVAAINDSVPNLTTKQRRAYVLRWLRWKLAEARVPGFARWAGTTPPAGG